MSIWRPVLPDFRRAQGASFRLSTVSSLKEEPNSGCLYILSPLLNVKENHIGAYLKSSVEKEA